MSRARWCCLLAVLAVVLGLPTVITGGAQTRGAAAVQALGPALAAGAGPVSRQAPAPRTAAGAPVSGAAVSWAAGPVVAAPHDTGAPGCGRDRDRTGADPALPARNRPPHDQGPGWLAPVPVVAAGRGPAPVPAPVVRPGSRNAAPTPVELSVLRV
ncbi:hypothetical protein CP967_16130 [Streptomyces nitrosporeus]|uniref:Uncharacterized protein n=1 Tax=Streptomyces nitrosporeus TaxID=28894 RepID=A0A5J6FBE5_9ACTN|nr:hypothetical protein [Streptomyces nitrosporeus]QEU73323.1 hypothetical protein CP967_16130 [Streptomyces nitrosporeus]GGZ16811.1 hypothetical protein GCM10010327_54660 [Streptomyces nitrosporeus]